MKLKIDDEYVDVGFWSFMKCNWLTTIALTGIVYGGLALIYIVFVMFGL